MMSDSQRVSSSRGGARQLDDQDSLLVSVDNDEIEGEGESAEIVPPVGWEFERLTTLPTASLLIVTNLAMIGLVFLIPGICEPTKDVKNSRCLVDPLSSLIYSHAIHWTFHLIADQYLKHCHKISRCKGYIEFYLNTKNLRRTPFYMVSIGNAVLLLTVTALHDYCDHGPDGVDNCPDKFTKVDYLRGLITLECMTIACIWVNYIMHVRDFHKKAYRPDIYRQDFVHTVCPEFAPEFLNENLPSTRDILEKQAELIRCMHQYVTKLNEKMSAALFTAAAAHNSNNLHHA